MEKNNKCLVLKDGSEAISSVKNFLKNEDNTSNIALRTSVPDFCREKNCILGIDEAGRGPVLGPLVYGICYCAKENEELLKNFHCADSKTLNEEKREEIFEMLSGEGSSIGWAVEVIFPNFISNCMLKRQKYTLNEISHGSAIDLIKLALSNGVNVTEVYVDTVGPPEKYQAKLEKIFPELKITVSKKADSLFPIVSAASICAKVVRDTVIKNWVFSEDMEMDPEAVWGSGYPNDPKTKTFLEENIDPVFGFPKIVRFSWSTADKILKDKCAPVEWSDDEDQISAGSSISKYFKVDEFPRHRFFTERYLERSTSL